jgi:D-glycero-alpha-D-manno-heptose 1-phosphate guanylyltransferase
MTMPPLLVLAGGFGTRLRSALDNVPKPLAPVAGRPYLYYLLENWVSQGVREFIFLLHHQADMIEEFMGSEAVSLLLQGCKVQTLIEVQPMGTGGAVAHAVRRLRLRGSFLVANSDTWLGSGLAAMVSTAAPAMAVLQVENTHRYGFVETSACKITAFVEKQHSAGIGWINAGMYNLNAGLFAQWDGKPFSLERGLFPLLAEAGRLNALPLQTEFIDIGIPADYFRFCRWIESQKKDVL